jgi:hypothetical protein
MVVFGAIAIIRGRFRIGRQTVGAPIAHVVGWTLVSAFPICFAIGLLVGVIEGLNGHFSATMDELQGEYGWIDPAITFLILATAVVLTVIGLKSQDPLLSSSGSTDLPLQPTQIDAVVNERATVGPPQEVTAGAFTDRPTAPNPYGVTRDAE